MSQRVKTLLKNNGSDFFARIGKIGYQVTCDRYFNGDREAMNRWLSNCGQWAIDRDLPYHKPDIFGHPGCHPAWAHEVKSFIERLEERISPNFPTFSDNRGKGR